MLKQQISQKLLGARSNNKKGGVDFRVWAPLLEELSLVLLDQKGETAETLPLKKDDEGYHECFVKGCSAGTRYFFRFENGDELPDPASRYQPLGPLGPSEVVEETYSWNDKSWRGLSLSEMVIYELHIGTFTEKGDFESAVAELPRLKALGINTIEILPVSQFSGHRNWGYDGVYPHAVQSTYGGPNGLKKLIDEAHKLEMAVVLDVVYNHLGPEGNFIPRYFPVFQDKYHTPWGSAINFDGPYSDGVKKYFLQTVWQWLEEYHIDGLRLDAIQTIFDTSPTPFLEQLTTLKSEIAHDSGRYIQIIGETDANDPRVVADRDRGGLGLDAHWNDDFHHAVHVLLSGERQGYYQDFEGTPDLLRLFTRGLAYEGRYSPYRKHTQGRIYEDLNPTQLVICSQNHDQIGNRLHSDRLTTIAGPEAAKLGAALVLISPFTPMLYMGEEYGETNPFQYFVSHQDESLNEAVRKGRREEFKAFKWDTEALDPVAEETFNKSKLNLSRRETPEGQAFEKLYAHLIALSLKIRKESLLPLDRLEPELLEDGRVLQIEGVDGFNVIFNLSKNSISLKSPREVAELLVDSSLFTAEAVNDNMEETFSARVTQMQEGQYELKAYSALAFIGQI